MRKRSRSWLRGNVKVFGRNVSVLLLAIALSATAAFALLTNYVSVTGEATVEQSVVLEECHVSVSGEGPGPDTCEPETATTASWTTTASGGDTRAVGLHLVNNGADSAPIDFVLAATIPGGAVWGSDVTAELIDGYNPSLEECVGSSVGTFTSETDVVSDTLDGDSDQWYCIELSWDIAAVPGAYGADVSINPAGP